MGRRWTTPGHASTEPECCPCALKLYRSSVESPYVGDDQATADAVVFSVPRVAVSVAKRAYPGAVGFVAFGVALGGGHAGVLGPLVAIIFFGSLLTLGVVVLRWVQARGLCQRSDRTLIVSWSASDGGPLPWVPNLRFPAPEHLNGPPPRDAD